MKKLLLLFIVSLLFSCGNNKDKGEKKFKSGKGEYGTPKDLDVQKTCHCNCSCGTISIYPCDDHCECCERACEQKCGDRRAK